MCCAGLDNGGTNTALLCACVRAAIVRASQGDGAASLLWATSLASAKHDLIVRATAASETRAGYGRDTVVDRTWGILKELPSNTQLAAKFTSPGISTEGGSSRVEDATVGAEEALVAMAAGSQVSTEQLMSLLSIAEDDSARAVILACFIQGQLHHMLGGHTIEQEVPFLEGGVDSLLSIELMNSINDRLSLRVTPAAMLEYPTISTLSTFLVSMLPRKILSAARLRDSPPPPPPTKNQGSDSAVSASSPFVPAPAVAEEDETVSSVEDAGEQIIDAQQARTPEEDIDVLALPGEQAYIKEFADTFIGMSGNIVRSTFLRAAKALWIGCFLRRDATRPIDTKYDPTWITSMYLREKWNANLGFSLVDDTRFVSNAASPPHAHALVARATALIIGALELRRRTYSYESLLAAGSDTAARRQLLTHGDMSRTQRYLFGTSRRPGPAADGYDVLAHFNESESDHFMIIANNRIWIVNISAMRTTTEIFKSVAHVVQCSYQEETNQSFSLGAMTHDFRARWRTARATLEEVVENRENFAVIDSSAFTVCLEQSQPGGNQAVLASVGSKSSNRWYDHTMQLVVFNDGRAGTIFNHAFIDGSMMLSACDAIQKLSMDADVSLDQEMVAPLISADGTNWVSPREVVMTPVATVAQDALRMVLRLKPRPSNIIATIHGIGSIMLGRAGLKPGSSINTLLQLAYFKAHGVLPRLVETVDLRHFRGGRLGWVLSNTAEAATFVRLVARARTPLRDNRAAVALLKAADAAHSAKIKKAMAGHVMPNESQMRFPAWVGMGALLLGDRFGRPQTYYARRFAMAGFVPAIESVPGMVRVHESKMPMIYWSVRPDAVTINISCPYTARAAMTLIDDMRTLLTKMKCE
jgi:acyl carrier protein